MDFAWLDRAGDLHDAPDAKIIDYFQYPEVRFSGFLRGCNAPPDALRREHQSRYGARILLLGVSGDSRTIGIVLTEAEDELVADLPEFPRLAASPSLQVLSFAGGPGVKPKDLLIRELTRIHRSGWNPSMILKPSEDSPVPFRGNQGGGYTLEALLRVPANADKAPDKYGYEIKSYSKGKISLMTPAADGGYEGKHTFREFMAKYGRLGQANDGRIVFTGVHRCGRLNEATGCVMSVDGYDPEYDEFSGKTDEIRVSVRKDASGEVVSSCAQEASQQLEQKTCVSRICAKGETAASGKWRTRQRLPISR